MKEISGRIHRLEYPANHPTISRSFDNIADFIGIAPILASFTT